MHSIAISSIVVDGGATKAVARALRFAQAPPTLAPVLSSQESSDCGSGIVFIVAPRLSLGFRV